MHHINAHGAHIPAIGFGTWTLRGGDCERLVAHALTSGYRHVDTAAMYENEAEVGAGIRASGIARDQVWLTTKVWASDIGAGDLQRSVAASLKRLKLDQVDLALIHWPSKTIPLADSIGALNEVAEQGQARFIGVSNFPTALLDQAAALSRVPLVCNQVEYHPYLNQDPVLAACRRHGMAMVSYCPLARGADLFSQPAVAEAAKRLGRTPAQVVLRWHVQQEGVVAIPRSSNPTRIAENLGVFDFSLTPDEMAAIDALRVRGHRICDFEFSPEWDPA